MVVSLTNFESDLLRLEIVWVRLMTIYQEYPNQMLATKHQLLVRHLFREVTVEQLHNFIRIRKDLTKNIKFKKFDDIIGVLIKPILEKAKPIKELRNNYVAHIQEGGRNFKDMMGDIILKYNLPTSFSFYRYLAGLVFFYSGAVERNFKEEWDTALSKYEAKSGAKLTISSGFKINDVPKEITKIFAPLQVKLFDEGYAVTISKKLLEQLRKKYYD